MKTICRKNSNIKLRLNRKNFSPIQFFGFLVGCFISIATNAQSSNKLLIGTFKANQFVVINTADYMLRCPITWRVDSVDNLLTITPRVIWKDSVTVSIHSFSTEVLPFNSFMKDPTVDFDAKTTIEADNNLMVYKVTSTKHCDTCANQNRKSLQYYNIPNNKVYILYYTASNKLLKKYKDDLDMILTSFELKNQGRFSYR